MKKITALFTVLSLLLSSAAQACPSIEAVLMYDTPKELLYNYISLIRQCNPIVPEHVATVEAHIEETVGCGHYPGLNKITRQDKVWMKGRLVEVPKGVKYWNQGCLYGLMAAAQGTVKFVLDHAEAFIKIRPKSLTRIAHEGDAPESGGYYNHGGFIQVDDLTSAGTLIHELTHYLMHMVYNNWAEPFSSGDRVRHNEISHATAQAFLALYKINHPAQSEVPYERAILAEVLSGNNHATGLGVFESFRNDTLNIDARKAIDLSQFTEGGRSTYHRMMQFFESTLYTPRQYNREIVAYYLTYLMDNGTSEKDVRAVMEPVVAYWDQYIAQDARNKLEFESAFRSVVVAALNTGAVLYSLLWIHHYHGVISGDFKFERGAFFVGFIWLFLNLQYV